MLTFTIIVLLTGLFKWGYPEAEITNVSFVIATLAFSAAIVVDKLLYKYLPKGDDNAGPK